MGSEESGHQVVARQALQQLLIAVLRREVIEKVVVCVDLRPKLAS